MIIEDTWPNVCVLCATRDRQTRLKYGHVCSACTDRLVADVRAIADLAVMAAASLTPRAGTGSAHSVPSSRPPINVHACDPELTLVGPPPAATVLDVVEGWERLIRDARGYAAYGPASAARVALASSGGTQVTLLGCVRFLAAQVPWAVAEPTFPVDDFADEIRACVRALRRFDPEASDRGTMVRCPTLTDDGDCGYRLRYDDVHEDVTCRRCGTTRSAMTLAAVAMADGAEVWLDPEAAASWLGVTEGTLRQWARAGRVRRAHGRYLIGDRMGA